MKYYPNPPLALGKFQKVPDKPGPEEGQKIIQSNEFSFFKRIFI